MIPDIGMVHEIPSPLLDSARFRRAHSAVAKASVRKVLQVHHKKTLPGHFKQTNKSKYDHKARSKKWRSDKRRKYGSITDLVASGETKRKMLGTTPKIAVGGTADTFLHGTMTLSFPFGKDGKRRTSAVTLTVMRKEIARWTDDEQMAAGALVQQEYAKGIEERFANAPKIRKQLGAKSFMLGS